MRKFGLTAGVLLSAAALTGSSAQAAPVTVGQLFAPATACAGSVTYVQTGVASGNSYTVPVTGVITSWIFQDAGTTNPGLKLKVVRPAGGGNYTVVGESTAGAQTVNALNVFPAAIPVQAGDVVGVFSTGGGAACGTHTGNTGDTYVFNLGDPAPGSTSPFGSSNGLLLPVSAVIQQPPVAASVSPSLGSPKGGTQVTITGHDFTGSTVVKFGGAPAASFTVGSDTQIKAVSPPGSADSAVDVTVSSAAGQSPSVAGDRFTYGCLVPKLKGKQVKPAKKALRNTGCRLGKVKGSRGGKVKTQTPKPGTLVAPGDKVTVKLA